MAASTGAAERELIPERDWMHLVQTAPTSQPPRPPENDNADVVEGRPIQNSVVSLIAGPFATLVSQIWMGDNVKEYLTATDARRHLWHAWLSSDRVAFQVHNPMSLRLAYNRLTFTCGKDLIVEAYDCQPAGLMRALSKLGAEARQPNVYRALARTLAVGGGGAKFIRHAPELPDSLILGLSSIPSRLPDRSVLDMLNGSRVAPEVFGAFGWTLSRIEDLKGQRVAQSALRSAKPLDALWDAMLDFPFPEPPWSGDDRLVPIRSRSHLNRIATEFENCLSDAVRQRQAVIRVLNGDRYFYEWQGKNPALLECWRVGPVGWYLKQVRGPKNRDLPEGVRERIQRSLTQAPAFCPVWPRDWYEVGEGFLP